MPSRTTPRIVRRCCERSFEQSGYVSSLLRRSRLLRVRVSVVVENLSCRFKIERKPFTELGLKGRKFEVGVTKNEKYFGEK